MKKLKNKLLILFALTLIVSVCSSFAGSVFASEMSENILLKDPVFMQNNVFEPSDLSVATYANGVITGGIGNRSINPLTNVYTEQTEYNVDGVATPANEADVYMKCKMTVGESGGVYSKLGMMFGKIPEADGSVTYLAVEFEPMRGYAFLFWSKHPYEGAKNSAAGESVIFNGRNLGLDTGKTFTVELYKRRLGIDLYLNGEQLSSMYKDYSVYLPDALPVIGGYFSNHSGSLSDFEFRILGSNVSIDIKDKRPEEPVTNFASNLSEVVGTYDKNMKATVEDGSLNLNVNYEEKFSATLPFSDKKYLWVQQGLGYARYSTADLATYMSFDFSVNNLTAPIQNWYGFGVEFRRSEGRSYSVRLGTEHIFLMLNGNEVSRRTLRTPYTQGVEYSLQILSDGAYVSVWLDDRLYFDRVVIEQNAETLPDNGLAFLSVYSDVTVSNIKYGFLKNVLLANPTYSDNANLKDIRIDGISLTDFSSDKFEYSIKLSADESMPSNVLAIPQEPNATVERKDEENKVSFVVTSQDGETKKTYCLNFIKPAEEKTVTLLSLRFNGVPLKDFSVEKFNYEITLASGVSRPDSSSFAVEFSSQTEFDFIPTELGYDLQFRADKDNIVTCIITFVEMGSNDARLGSVSYKGKVISGFDTDKKEYKIEVDGTVDLQQLTAVAMSASATIEQTVKDNTVTLKVTAKDGTSSVYTVTVVEKQTGCGATLWIVNSLWAVAIIAIGVFFFLKKCKAKA